MQWSYLHHRAWGDEFTVLMRLSKEKQKEPLEDLETEP